MGCFASRICTTPIKCDSSLVRNISKLGIKYILPICLLLILASCYIIQEIAYLNVPKDELVLVSNASGGPPHASYFIGSRDSLQVEVHILRDWGLKEDHAPGMLLVDIAITPSAADQDVSYHPEHIQVVVRGDTLPYLSSRVTCGYPNTCYHRAIFKMNKESTRSDNSNSDSAWCQVDLTRAIMYRDTLIKFDQLIGWLPE